MALHLTEVDLAALTQELLAELEPLVARSPARLTLQAPEAMPPLRTDRHKLKQVLVNLVTNALKFTGEGRIDLVLTHDAASDSLRIAVRDTGPGIAPEDQERIFEPFHRGAAHGGTEGSGL